MASKAALAVRARVPLDTIQSFPTLSEICLGALKALHSEIAPAHHEPRECRRCRPFGGASRTIDASKRGLAAPMTGARKEPVVFVELDTRRNADDTVSLEAGRATGETEIVVADIRDESLLVFPVSGANAGEGFRHPFRQAR